MDEDKNTEDLYLSFVIFNFIFADLFSSVFLI